MLLPVDVVPLKKDVSEMHKFNASADGTAHNFSKKREVPHKKPKLSFMIEDILGDFQSKSSRTCESGEAVTSPCNQCSPSDKGVYSEQCFNSFSEGHNRFISSATSAFASPLSSVASPLTSPQAKLGYYSPAIASSPPFSSRTPDVFTFIPNDFNEQLQVNYFRQDSFVHSPLYSPPVILDLSNCGLKPASTRIPHSSVLAMPNSNAGE